MAQALFERHAPPDIRAESAGQQPAEWVWPEVVEAMREIDIDLSDRRPCSMRCSEASSAGRLAWMSVMTATLSLMLLPSDDRAPLPPGVRLSW
jgi:arsenate reductase (thioredoxin)